MSGMKISVIGDGVNLDEPTESLEVPKLKEHLLKWIPNSNPEFIGTFQLVDMSNNEVVLEGDADLIADYIAQEELTSNCGWIWS